MPLQFATQNDLETDLASKDGISAVGNLIAVDTEFNSFGTKWHKIQVSQRIRYLHHLRVLRFGSAVGRPVRITKYDAR